MSQFSFNQQTLAEMEKLRSPNHIVEQKSEDSVKNEDAISQGGMPDLNKRQAQAVDKLNIYQKGWKRMNKVLNRGPHKDTGVSLMDQQN